ncbi:MAG: pseudaminic acid synthase [Candidatus Magasanikbacteria bacterium]|nr:pseudaminic acid synthase [Candidatus Magasanikbacteria bacterium]
MEINGRKIGANQPCFIVAEMSANHEQNFEKAVAIVKAAALAGVDAIKLQTYTPDTMTIDLRKKWFFVGGKDNPDSWQGKTFYDLYKTAYTPWEWHAPLQKIATDLGLVFFSAPFDPTAVDYLENLNVPLYKIASYECTDLVLLKKVAQTGKPIIMSVGFATLPEIELSVATLRENGAKDIAILHCVTSYADTTKPEESNLRTMLALRDHFKVVCGFSDNNAGVEIPILAAAMGGSIIEKHLVLESNKQELDSRFSLNKNDFKVMVERIRENERIMGAVHFGPQNKAEEYNRQFRRSLFVVADIKKGEVFTSENIRSIRPAYGLETKYMDQAIGRKAVEAIERGTPLSWELIEHD